MPSVIYEYNKKYIKAYQEANKDKIKLKNTERIKCDLCNTYIARYSLSRHRKSEKHKKLLFNK